jgi:hypothetical protein
LFDKDYSPSEHNDVMMCVMQKMHIALETNCPTFLEKEFLVDHKLNLNGSEIKILLEGFGMARGLQS